MPRSAASCRSNLELHGGKWRVTVAVPRELRPVLGTRLKRPLGTDSLAVANTLKHRGIADLRDRIQEARARMTGKANGVLREAAQIRETYREATDVEEVADTITAVLQREEELLGAPIRKFVEPENGERFPVYDPKRQELALAYRKLATGAATSITLHHDEYLNAIEVTKRTRADDIRAVD